MLIGIDDATYATVSDFSQYLLHPENKKQLSFALHENGYSDRLPQSGWDYRRYWLISERAAQEDYFRNENQELEDRIPSPGPGGVNASEPFFAPLPKEAPLVGRSRNRNANSNDGRGDAPGEDNVNDLVNRSDPFGTSERRLAFDEMNEHYTGLILGIAIASSRNHKSDGKVEEVFAVRPGDDVQITLPSSGVPPQPVSAKFTVVDLYESKMHEYDSSVAFVPLSKLQHLRGTIDPQTKITTVSSIQIKLKPEADLFAVQTRLQQRFPQQRGYFVQTWRETHGPLFQAVELETTILNVLLFLIIAVAGFGILATFFMIVVEKTRDIGILKSLGASGRGIARTCWTTKP
ncbi:MAG: ABC transporter permease [Planctomycetes bacterium]|nr:ABC transporter permease [Planctomycetota bacterium]